MHRWVPPPPSPEPDEHEATEDFAVLAHVCDMLVEECGFDVATAIELAHDHIDWHEAQRLLDHGCPHALVVKILS